MGFLLLALSSGIFWTLAYLFIIQRGQRDHTYGMPLAALFANISWEFIFAFVHPSHGIQRAVNVVWFALDVVIVGQALRYGRREFATMSAATFYGMFALGMATAFPLVWLISQQFDNWAGAYAAFGQNLMMSILFIAMWYRRTSPRGQSLSIAICKGLGTLSASAAFYRYTNISHHSVVLPFLYVAIALYDAIYIALLYRQKSAAA